MSELEYVPGCENDRSMKLRHHVGVCSSCEGNVLCVRIDGWGLVPNTAYCIACHRQAETVGSAPVVVMKGMC